MPTATEFRFSIMNANEDRIGIQLEYAAGTSYVVEASNNNLANLSLGDLVSSSTATTVVGSAQNYISSNGASWHGSSVGLFSQNTPGYMGFSFTSNAQTYYGWAKITVASGGLGLTINQWAYSTSAITVGAGAPVPEPSTYAALAGLMVLGTTVIVRRRQRSAEPVAA